MLKLYTACISLPSHSPSSPPFSPSLSLCPSLTCLPRTHSKISELQKKAGELKREVDEGYLLADSVVNGSMGKQQYVERDRAIQSRLSRLQTEIDGIVQGLGL